MVTSQFGVGEVINASLDHHVVWIGVSPGYSHNSLSWRLRTSTLVPSSARGWQGPASSPDAYRCWSRHRRWGRPTAVL